MLSIQDKTTWNQMERSVFKEIKPHSNGLMTLVTICDDAVVYRSYEIC